MRTYNFKLSENERIILHKVLGHSRQKLREEIEKTDSEDIRDFLADVIFLGRVITSEEIKNRLTDET
jgi:hypothetical protein